MPRGYRDLDEWNEDHNEKLEDFFDDDDQPKEHPESCRCFNCTGVHRLPRHYTTGRAVSFRSRFRS